MGTAIKFVIRNTIIRKVEFAIQGNIEALPLSIENEIKTSEFPQALKCWNEEEINNLKIQSLCDDAVTILQYCVRHKYEAASEYVTEFVKKLHEKLIVYFKFKNQPEKFYWTEVSKSIVRLLTTYTLLANFEDNAEIKRSICHEVISKMVPPLNPKLPWTYKTSDTIISLSLPRACSIFIHEDIKKFKEEIKDDIFLLIEDQYTNLKNNEELRDNFEYYHFYENLYAFYKKAIKDNPSLINFKKFFDDDDNNDKIF